MHEFPPDQSILNRNLAALSRTSPSAVRAIAAAAPSPSLRAFATPAGAPAFVNDHGPTERAVCSRRDPLAEARRFADSLDPRDAGAAIVLGFGAGHHVAEVSRRYVGTGGVLVYEPDVPMLRFVLERVDHSAWLAVGHTALVTDPNDTVAMTNAFRGIEPLIAMGIRLMPHAPSLPRLGDSAARFGEQLTSVVRAIKTNVLTTLVQSPTTLRNILMNLAHYATGGGIAPLAGVAAGCPAIVVSAGPSLRRNLDQLSDPRVRERVVVIAVQTVLKTMLARGIRPDFVTALDYHEVSRRFYEGLTEADCRGVTLIVEPKANPAILDSFPGRILCAEEELAEALLGELRRRHGPITPGATVAHLAYHLARHMGCDPVILIGQDLGFTDGQYYAAGAAIHEVWSSELSGFRTLEMFEWERIVRSRHRLHKAADQMGRPIYTDEQMLTYLIQFERLFEQDAGRGLTTIDATQGGVGKRHTTTMTLREALAPVLASPTSPDWRRVWEARDREHLAHGTLPQNGTPAVLAAVVDRVRTVRQGAWKIATRSRAAVTLLEKILAAQSDQRLVNELIGRIKDIEREVTSTEPAYRLTQFINQTGALNRYRADRRIELDTTALGAMGVQAAQTKRDIQNVSWIADAAEHLGDTLEATILALEGGPKQTRDTPPPPPPAGEVSARLRDADGGGKRASNPRTSPTIAAIIPVDPDIGGLGTRRSLESIIFPAENLLESTLRRLSAAKSLTAIYLLTEHPDRVRELAGRTPSHIHVEIIPVESGALATRRRGVAPARCWAYSCWRGGLAGLSCYDEAFDPALFARVMHERNLDAAVVVGADWALIDPGLVDQVVARHLEEPAQRPLTFCQCPPGLGAACISRGLVLDLARQADRAGPLASIGGILSYFPTNPRSDLIVSPACVTVPPQVRDLPIRCVPDSEPRRKLLLTALDEIEARAAWAGAAEIGEAIATREASILHSVPQLVTLELCTGRLSSGRRREWTQESHDACERPVLDRALARRIFDQLADARTDIALTLAGAGDPMLHPSWLEIAADAKDAGIGAVHLRTELNAPDDQIDRLIADAASPDGALDVISIDLMAGRPDAYTLIMGVDAFDRVTTNLERLLAGRRPRSAAAGIPTPWIVPRLTRCEAVIDHIESFYDAWLSRCGHCVIDPLPRTVRGERIEPLPLPSSAAWRRARSGLSILCDGSVPQDLDDLQGGTSAGSLTTHSVREIWKRLHRARLDARTNAEPVAQRAIAPAPL